MGKTPDEEAEQRRKEALAARRANLHMQRTPFSERILPAVLLVLAVLTVILILIALGVLFGILSWR